MALERLGLGAEITMDHVKAVKAMATTATAMSKLVREIDQAPPKTTRLGASFDKMIRKIDNAGMKMKRALCRMSCVPVVMRSMPRWTANRHEKKATAISTMSSCSIP